MESNRPSRFDDSELDIQYILKNMTEASGTPPKDSYSSHLYTHRSVDRHSETDLQRYRYSDITFETFLKCSFGVTDTDMAALEKRVQEISTHKTEEYKAISAEFANVAGDLEAKTYELFAEMGNMVLDAHQQQSGNRIKVLPSAGNEHDQNAIRRPHVTLVPQKDGNTEIDLKSVRWDHMLCVLEFKKPSLDSTTQNHPQEEEDSAIIDDAEIQLAHHITEVMSHFSGRTFTFGAIVKHTKMQLAYYSRSLYVLSDEIDIVGDPVMFAAFLCLFSMQSLDKLGFSTDMDLCDPFDSKIKRSRKLDFEMDPVNGGDSYVLNPGMKLELGEYIHIEHCLIGRATTVFNVKRPKGCKVDLVAKFQWHSKTRRREDRAILIAREVDAEHSPEIYGVATLGEKSPSENFKVSCRVTPVCEVEERELRVLLMRKYNPVEELNDEEFCEVVPQFAAYVHALFSQRELLHRDISIANMAYYVKDGKLVATLIDFDLATFPDETFRLKGAERPSLSGSVNESSPLSALLEAPMVYDASLAVPSSAYEVAKCSNRECQERSGTTPFMAIETLDVELSPYVHHLCHDLESLFYVSVWHGVGYRWKAGITPRFLNLMKRKKIEILRGWRVGSREDVVMEKVAFLANPMHILKHIKSERLRAACMYLSITLGKRATDIRQRAMFRDDPDVFVGKYKPRTMTIIEQSEVGKALYPYFADIWDMDIMDCQKSCCVYPEPRSLSYAFLDSSGLLCS